MKKLSLRARLILLFLTLALVSLGVFGAITLVKTSRLAEDIQNNKLNSDMTSLTTFANAMIDPEDLYTLLESGDESDPLYTDMQDLLNYILEANPYIDSGRMYVAIAGDNPDEVIMVVDTETDPNEHFALGEIYAPDPEFEKMLDAFDGPQVDDYYNEDQFGNTVVYGYGPLHDYDGNVVGIIGVDLQAESVFDATSEVTFSFIITAVFLFPIVIVVIWMISSAISKPVVAIADAAGVVERGDEYTESMLEKVAARSDELGQLARVFSKMAIEVQARERQLKTQVKELEIQIDLVKQNSQVSEIVDSDFFQNLKAQAKQMREEGEKGK